MIATYTALVALAILRDDFTRLDRRGLVTLLRSSQREDGRFVLASIVVSKLTERKALPQTQLGVTQICA